MTAVTGLRSSAAAIVLLAGCTVSSPSPGTSAGAGSPTWTANRSIPAATEAPWLQTGTINQEFTTPTLEYRSTGTYLIWSSAARADPDANTAPDLFGSTPGGPVTLQYDNPNRDSRLELIGGDGDRIVFVETNPRVFGQGKWKLWHIARPGAAAELITEASGTLPFFDVSGTRLVYAFTGGKNYESQLWLVDLETMQRRRLLTADGDLTQYWFPSIDGHLVVYGALEVNVKTQAEERHIWLLDISDERGDPRRLDGDTTSGNAPFTPTIRGDTVVWKESPAEESFLSGGTLVRYSLATRVTEPLTLDPSNPRYTFSSIGGRYVAGWSDNDRALYLADLETGQPLKVVDLGPTNEDPHDNVGLVVSLADDLLAYLYGPGEGDLELRWIVLR